MYIFWLTKQPSFLGLWTMSYFQILAIILVTTIAIACLVYKNERHYKHPLIANVTSIDPDFRWQEQPPLPIRPFVGKRNFNPKIGVKNISKTPHDWLLIENTYLKVTTLKAQSLKRNPTQTMHIDKTTNPSTRYKNSTKSFLTFTWRGFPDTLHWITKLAWLKTKSMDWNSEKMLKLTAHELLRNIGSNMEEDFVLLLKNDASKKTKSIFCDHQL